MKYIPEIHEQYKTKNDNYFIGTHTYYIGTCEVCNILMLYQKGHTGRFCSYKCANSGENNSMYGSHRNGDKSTFHGRIHKPETKQKMGEVKLGETNPNWKGGVSKLNIPLYDTYAHQLEPIEQCRKTKEGYLEVKCTTCGKWFIPKGSNVRNRIKIINGKEHGDRRFYCSNECKSSCSIYGQKKYPKGHKPEPQRDSGISRELAQMVFERDDYCCVECGSTENIECHHKDGILYNPIESADTDICETLCHKCHKLKHQQPGMRYIDLQCK
jgi:hypothetical protein